MRPTDLADQLVSILAESTAIRRIALIDFLDEEVSRLQRSAPAKDLLAQLLRDVETRDGRSIRPVRLRSHAPSLRRGGNGLCKAAEEQKACALEVQVDNAGLVLLWPHLGEIFRKLKLLERLDGLRERPELSAALLLQQLVTGKPAGQESSLALNKLLCGIAPNVPIPRRRRRSADWAAEVEVQLTTAIRQWSALENTSVAGLRSSFLQREGLLRQKDFGWTLQVERKSYDILLEQLPWGVGMIQMSWMGKPIRVDW